MKSSEPMSSLILYFVLLITLWRIFIILISCAVVLCVLHFRAILYSFGPYPLFFVY